MASPTIRSIPPTLRNRKDWNQTINSYSTFTITGKFLFDLHKLGFTVTLMFCVPQRQLLNQNYRSLNISERLLTVKNF